MRRPYLEAQVAAIYAIGQGSDRMSDFFEHQRQQERIAELCRAPRAFPLPSEGKRRGEITLTASIGHLVSLAISPLVSRQCRVAITFVFVTQTRTKLVIVAHDDSYINAAKDELRKKLEDATKVHWKNEPATKPLLAAAA